MKTNRRLRVNGKVIREQRQALGLSVQAAAQRIGISRQALYGIERGAVRYPHQFTLLNISVRLGIPLHKVAS